MPAAIAYYMDQRSPEARIIEEAFSAELSDRQTAYTRGWDYYQKRMHKPLKAEQDNVDDNVLMPLVGRLSDKLVNFLLGDEVAFDAGADGEENEADERVEALWQANRKEALLHDIALSGVVTGHCVMKIEPREGQEPRLVSINPANFAAFWSVDDIERVLWYRLQYQLGDAGKRIDYVRGAMNPDGSWNHEVDRWAELVYRQSHQSLWQLDKLTPLEWDFAPIVDWKNLPIPFAYYGLADINDVLDLNDTVNLIMSDINRILKHYASPRLVVTGAELEGTVETAIGNALNLPDPQARAELLEMTADLTASQSFAAIIERTLWQSGGMVDPQTMKDLVGGLTNFGLRVLYKDAVDKINTKRLLYGEGFGEVSRRALIMGGQAAPEKIGVVWSDPLPMDKSADSTRVVGELGAGLIDKQTAREELGYDNDKINERLEEEQTQDDNVGARVMRLFEQGANQNPIQRRIGGPNATS